MTTSLRTHILLAGLPWLALLFAAPPAANAGTILGAPTYIGLSSGLVGWWTMDGGDISTNSSGLITVVDRSGNGNRATTASVAATPARTIGKIGQALEFDGSNDLLTATDINATDGASQMSLAAWIYQRSTADSLAIISKFGGDTNWVWATAGAGTSGGNDMEFWPRDTNAVAYTQTDAHQANVWEHWVVVFDGTQTGDANRVKMYKNGVQQTGLGFTATIPATTNTTATAITFSDSVGFFDGTIDDARIYNRAITADEIKRLYKIGATAKIGAPNSTGSLASGLVGYWTFDGKDIAGNIAYNRGSTSTADGSISVFGTGRMPVKALGKMGQALDFDGAASYVEIGTNFVNMPRFSVGMWAYPRTQGESSWSGFMSGGTVCTAPIIEGWIFGFYGGFGQRGEICFEMDYDGASNLQVISNQNVATFNEWQHFLLTWDGSATAAGGVRMYRNGVEVGYATQVNGVGTRVDEGPSPLMSIGTARSSNTEFDGMLDDVRIYNRVISPDEIKRLYKIGSTLKQGVASSNGLLAKNFWSYWSFDGKDVAGSDALTIYDRATNGTADNGTTSASGPRLTIGKIGQAFDFDGVDDYISFARSPQQQCIEFDNGMFTAWMRPTGDALSAATAYDLPPVLGELGGYMGIFRGTFGGEDRIWVYNYDGTDDQVGFAYTPGEWVHVAWVHSGGVLSAYKNGILAASIASGSTNNFGLFRIGTGWTGGANKFFLGQIDEVRCYWPAPSPDEIKRLYNMGR